MGRAAVLFGSSGGKPLSQVPDSIVPCEVQRAKEMRSPNPKNTKTDYDKVRIETSNLQSSLKSCRPRQMQDGCCGYTEHLPPGFPTEQVFVLAHPCLMLINRRRAALFRTRPTCLGRQVMVHVPPVPCFLIQETPGKKKTYAVRVHK